MARSIWNGTITFGLIAVPIKVNSATEDKSVHFHQVHAADGSRIKQKRICSKENKEVPFKQVAKGYELRGGKYVMLEQEEIDAAAGDSSHLIELEEFVGAAEIDPVFYDRTYYIGAGNDGGDAYRLLHDALRKSDRAGLGPLGVSQPRVPGRGPAAGRRAGAAHDAVRRRARRPRRPRHPETVPGPVQARDRDGGQARGIAARAASIPTPSTTATASAYSS